MTTPSSPSCARRCTAGEVTCGACKQETADRVEAFLADFRERMDEVAHRAQEMSRTHDEEHTLPERAAPARGPRTARRRGRTPNSPRPSGRPPTRSSSMRTCSPRTAVSPRSNAWSRRSYDLTEEGRQYAAAGLPERQLFAAMGDRTPMTELKAHPLASIGIGWLRRKGWVTIRDGVVERAGDAPEGEDERALLARSADRRPRDSATFSSAGSPSSARRSATGSRSRPRAVRSSRPASTSARRSARSPTRCC